MGSHDGVAPRLRRRRSKSAPNVAPELFLSYLPLSISLSAISLLLSAVDHSCFFFHPLLLQSYDLLSTVNPASTFSFVSFTSARSTAEDYQRTAKENGWVSGVP